MTDLIAYVNANGKRSFADLPMTDVDGVILAQLAYVDFETLVAHHVTGFADLTDPVLMQHVVDLTWNPTANFNLLLALRSSPRFRNIRWHDLVKDTDTAAEKQFCAVTFDLGHDFHYIAYRGTTATLTDWKEDFNMTFMRDIPSQRSALRYYQKNGNAASGHLLFRRPFKGR